MESMPTSERLALSWVNNNLDGKLGQTYSALNLLRLPNLHTAC